MTAPTGPEPRLLAFVAEQRWGVLATIRRDGRPQLSNVGHAWDDGLVRVSVTADPGRGRAAMVADQRLAVRFRPEHAYGPLRG